MSDIGHALRKTGYSITPDRIYPQCGTCGIEVDPEDWAGHLERNHRHSREALEYIAYEHRWYRQLQYERVIAPQLEARGVMPEEEAVVMLEMLQEPTQEVE